jgi:HSP20 family protein
VERARGTFYRRFNLPDVTDGEKIHAKMQNGVLEVTLPKKEAANRQVEIKIE